MGMSISSYPLQNSTCFQQKISSVAALGSDLKIAFAEVATFFNRGEKVDR